MTTLMKEGGDGQDACFIPDDLRRTAGDHNRRLTAGLVKEGLLTLEETAAHVASSDLVLCKGCGKAIPEKRLKVVPKATRCTSCQAPHDEYARPPETAMAVDTSGDVYAEFADSLRSS